MYQTLKRFERPITKTVAIDYWLYLPLGYERDNRPWPLLLYLHGAGERGDLEKAKKHGPARQIAAGMDLPFIVVTPSCPAERWWDPEALENLLKDVCGTYRIDEDRVYGTGLSMGGFGLWAAAITYPRRFAAIAPICGGGSPYMAYRIAHIPVWTFHGDKDPIVPSYESERMVQALRKVGGDVRYTVYPGAEHDVWSRTYDNPELYDWLLAQRRR